MHRQRSPSHLECSVQFCALWYKEHSEWMNRVQLRATKVMKGLEHLLWGKSESWDLLLKRSQGYLRDVCKHLTGGDEAETRLFSMCPLACQQWATGTNGNASLGICKTWLNMIKWWQFYLNQLVYVNCISSYSHLKRIPIWMAIIVLDQDFIKFCVCAEHLSCSFFPSLLWMSYRYSMESICEVLITLVKYWFLILFYALYYSVSAANFLHNSIWQSNFFKV